jgi:hypothetical protein
MPPVHDYNPAYDAISAAGKFNKINQLYELAEGMGHSAKTNNPGILQLSHQSHDFLYHGAYNFASGDWI